MITYSIIKKSQLEGALRLDAEYYQPEYFNSVKKIEEFGCKNMGDLLELLTDYHANGSYEVLKRNVEISSNRDFALMVRSVDLEMYNFDNNVRYVSENAYNFLKKTKIFGNEIIIDKIGNTGAVYLMPKLNRPVTLGMNLFMLRPKKEIDSEFLYVFLNSKLGKSAISQKITGMNPTSIDKASIRSIKIPIVSKNFSQEIRQLVQEAFLLQENSKKLYSQAEGLFLEELGLSSFAKASEDEERFCVVNLSDVKNVNRMDAEYFQLKYEKLISKIKNKNPKILGNFVKEYSTGFPFQSENYQKEGIPLIRINNIRKGFLDLNDTAYLSEKDYLLSPKDTAKPGDIVLSMSGTIGMSAVVSDDIRKSSINQRILRITPKNIDKDYFTLLLNSIIGSYQLERIGTGGVQTNISYKDIKNILIPALPKATQQKIAELVKKSHNARKKAKELLEEAKTKVEQLIENK